MEMQRQSREEYYVITSDMVALDEHVVKAQAWTQRAEVIKR